MNNIKIPKGFNDWDVADDKREKELYRDLRDGDPDDWKNSELLNNLDSMTFLREDGAGNSLVHDKRDNKLKVYYHDWNPDTLHDLTRSDYLSNDEYDEMQELMEKAKRDLPGIATNANRHKKLKKVLPLAGAAIGAGLGAWAGYDAPTDKIKNALKMGGALGVIGGAGGWAIGDEMKPKVDLNKLNKHMKSTYGKDGYTNLMDAERQIGSFEEDRYYNSKGVPKMASDIVNDSFEKIADDLETKVWEDRVKPTLKRALTATGVGVAVGIPTLGIGTIPAAMGTSIYLNDKKLKQMSKELLGRDATTQERLYNSVGNPVAATLLTPVTAGLGGIALGLNTPESQVKRRARAARDGVQNTEGLYFFNDDSFKREEKKASEIINEAFQKIAHTGY